MWCAPTGVACPKWRQAHCVPCVPCRQQLQFPCSGFAIDSCLPSLLSQVLSIYPTTIRRRILRHLYLRHLRASYLFRWADLLSRLSRLMRFRP